MTQSPGRDDSAQHIALLHRTPADTVCPNFYILDHAHGCNFDCSYCFLKDPEYENKRREVFGDTENLFAELGAWVERENLETYLANAGNMADSFAFERERPLWGALIEFMRENAEKRGRPHCLLAVTKGGPGLLGAFFSRKPCRNVIVSFSVNSPEAAGDHEKGAASPVDRLAAARMLKEQGWRVRIRLDPMIRGYGYAWVIGEIRALAPERVTLGTLRADPTLVPVMDGVGIFTALEKSEDGALARYPLAERLKLYGQAVDSLKDVTSLGLCEETPAVWEALGLDAVNKTCNCNPL